MVAPATVCTARASFPSGVDLAFFGGGVPAMSVKRKKAQTEFTRSQKHMMCSI
jgi:hypothetical protein